MSLIGIKINITDSATALSCKLRAILYRSELSLHHLPVDNLRSQIKQLIVKTDIWWATKPYVRIALDESFESLMMKQFRLKKFAIGKYPILLLDICAYTNEPNSRFVRALDLDCSVDRVYMTEDVLTQSSILHPI